MGIIITVGEKYRDEISDILKNGGIDDYMKSDYARIFVD